MPTAEQIEAVMRDQIVLRHMGPDSFIEGFEEAAAKLASLFDREVLETRGASDMRERAALEVLDWRENFADPTTKIALNIAAGKIRALALNSSPNQA